MDDDGDDDGDDDDDDGDDDDGDGDDDDDDNIPQVLRWVPRNIMRITIENPSKFIN